MIYIDNDYTYGAHPLILERLLETNSEQAPGYGTDRFTKNAIKTIKSAIGREDIDVYFLSGGTQTNIVSIASTLRPFQGVITADTGHINNLEAGAIEAIGHRMLTIPSADGKISAHEVRDTAESYWNNSSNVHLVQPGMVYISNPTETGTLYSKNELEELREVCDEFNMVLFIDGARLGYGLVAETNDMTLNDVANLCDIFYIGGTKIGALFGEALIVSNQELKNGVQTIIKQKGALLAKGRALGIQFETLFKDDLYLKLSKHAVEQAMKIKQAFLDKGIRLKYEAFTNQLFPILTKEQLDTLEKNYVVLHQGSEGNDQTVVRICTSWATEPEQVEKLIEVIRNF